MEPTYTYRSTEATVSRKKPNGSINIFWRGAQAKDVNKFMSDFLNIYKQGAIPLKKITLYRFYYYICRKNEQYPTHFNHN